MKAHEYRDLVARYIAQKYKNNGLEVFTEIEIGTSIVGKKRKVDILVINPETDTSIGLECKTQKVGGTAEEKLYYALEDVSAMPIKGLLVYFGEGFTDAFKHLLAASPNAVYCKPPGCESGNPNTHELDVLLYIHFGFLRRNVPENRKVEPYI